MNKKIKKSLLIFNTIIYTLLLAISLIVIISIAIAKTKGEQPHIFGFTFHIVITDSMTPEINIGDFIIAEKADKDSIQIGDNIIFISPDPALKGITIVHKVIEKTNENGQIQFTTKGIKEGAPTDTYPVKTIIGKYKAKSVFIGTIYNFISKMENILFSAFIFTFIVIIIKQVKKIILIKRDYEKDSNKK